MFLAILQALILGIVQGLTEFLPVSSTGHLILIQNLFGLSEQTYGLAFDAAVHLGTAAAVFWFFSGEWLLIIKQFFQGIRIGRFNEEGRLGLYLLLATIPAAMIGYFFEDIIENVFQTPQVVAFGLLAGSVAMFSAEQLGKKIKGIGGLNIFQSLVIGISQSIALLPGISRSGITISTGMYLGLNRKSAAQFAFLLSGPIVLGAGGKQFIEVILSFTQGGLSSGELGFFLIGIVSSAISGYLAIKFLLKYLVGHSLNIFVIYRLVLAGIILVLI